MGAISERFRRDLRKEAYDETHNTGSLESNIHITKKENETQKGKSIDDWTQVRRKTRGYWKGSNKYDSLPTLFVRGFPSGWFPLNLERVFGRAGAVMDVIMPRDKGNGQYRGFALIKMSMEEELSRAVSMLHSQSFGGEKLLVQRAQFGPEISNEGEKYSKK
ncbi:serine/arginine-rich SC35-like splicing factor SCL30 [Magnolia sinica]|uniref:serine/arginine-rich SC35-like splicing factor SCL30 n=1 Tax=Magnolia sinica TaxID=86752 RepID=UPI00265A5AC3|nr:serine/arginine-rich SC35-like splicing factor SCL30 [Magnolia sinica]